jgi:hypothetical protein
MPSVLPDLLVLLASLAASLAFLCRAPDTSCTPPHPNRPGSR